MRGTNTGGNTVSGGAGRAELAPQHRCEAPRRRHRGPGHSRGGAVPNGARAQSAAAAARGDPVGTRAVVGNEYSPVHTHTCAHTFMSLRTGTKLMIIANCRRSQADQVPRGPMRRVPSLPCVGRPRGTGRRGEGPTAPRINHQMTPRADMMPSLGTVPQSAGHPISLRMGRAVRRTCHHPSPRAGRLLIARTHGRSCSPR